MVRFIGATSAHRTRIGLLCTSTIYELFDMAETVLISLNVRLVDRKILLSWTHGVEIIISIFVSTDYEYFLDTRRVYAVRVRLTVVRVVCV